MLIYIFDCLTEQTGNIHHELNEISLIPCECDISLVHVKNGKSKTGGKKWSHGHVIRLSFVKFCLNSAAFPCYYYFPITVMRDKHTSRQGLSNLAFISVSQHSARPLSSNYRIRCLCHYASDSGAQSPEHPRRPQSLKWRHYWPWQNDGFLTSTPRGDDAKLDCR